MDDLHAHFIVRELLERGLDSLGAALHVGLDDDVEVLHLALLDAGEQVVERDLLAAGVGGILLLLLALLDELTRHALVGDGVELVARARHLGHAGDLDRDGRAGLRHALTLIVGHRAHTADGRAGDDDVTLMERAVLHEHGHDRAATLVHAGLDDRAAGGTVGVGLELQNFGEQDQVFEQFVHALAGLGRNRADDRLAAPLFGHETILRELLLDAVGVRAVDIHLVDGHDQRDAGGLRVVDRLDRLRHDAIIGRDDEDGDIRDHGAAGTHGRERLMARGIEEGDRLAVDHDAVSADVLRDAAGLTGRDVRAADAVEQAGLAVVDVAHDHHDRGARDEFVLAVLAVVDQALFDRHDDLVLDLAAELHGHERGGIVINGIGQRRHDAHLHETAHDLGTGLLHAGGELADGDRVRDLDLELLLFCDLQLQLLHLVALLLAALGAGGRILRTLTVAVLDLLLAAALILRALGHEIVQTLVVLGQVRRRAAGIDDAALGHLTRLVRLVVLLRLVLLLRLGSLLRLLCGCGFALGRSALRGRGCLRLGLRLVRHFVELLQAGRLMVLREILKDVVELVVLQHLHMIFRSGGIIRQDLRDLLRGHAEILRHLMHSVFNQSAHTRFLLLPLRPPPVGAVPVSVLVCAASSAAVLLYCSGSACASADTKAFARPGSVTAAMAQPVLPSRSDSACFVYGRRSSGACAAWAKPSARLRALTDASCASSSRHALPARAAAPASCSPSAMRPALRMRPR